MLLKLNFSSFLLCVVSYLVRTLKENSTKKIIIVGIYPDAPTIMWVIKVV